MTEAVPIPRILIADDDPLIRTLLVETLSAHGAEVNATALSGAAGEEGFVANGVDQTRNAAAVLVDPP